jgi:hypothetical protein
MENIFLGTLGKSSMGGDIGVEKGDFFHGRQEAGSSDHVRGLRLLQEGGGSGEVFSGAGRGSDAWGLSGVFQGADG